MKISEYIDGKLVIRDMTETEIAEYNDRKEQALNNTTIPKILSVTLRQARLYLLSKQSPDNQYPNMLAYVENWIENLQEPEKLEAKISWEYASTINRTDKFVDLLGQVLGLDTKAIDELFLEASTL